MTEPSEADKYIKCSKCRCKYHNNDDNIKSDFGYTRLGERYKTCIKCRKTRLDNYDKYKEYANEYGQQYYKDHREQVLAYHRARSKLRIDCDVCGKNGSYEHLNRHKKSHLCKKPLTEIIEN